MPLVRKSSGDRGARPPAFDLAAIRTALATGNDDERWSAARAAAEVRDVETVLGDALTRETNPRVREALFTSLARIATTRSVEVVLPFLRSDVAHLRTEASGALAAMKEVAEPYLATLLRDADADVRVLACELVRNLPNDSAVRLFCDLLDSEPERNVCAAAIDALAEIGAPAALPVLARCAERFRGTPFLVFSIRIATDRIRSQSPTPGA